MLLKSRFRSHPAYNQLVELFHGTTLQTLLGQLCDLDTVPQETVGLDQFSMERYLCIMKHKTAYYSFYLPVALALYYLHHATSENLRQARDILLQMGECFRIQDDYLDVFGDPGVLGKVGADIQDNKYSWGDDVAVMKVESVFKDLDLQLVYRELEQEYVKDLRKMTEAVDESEGLDKRVFEAFLSKIYKRINFSAAFSALHSSIFILSSTTLRHAQSSQSSLPKYALLGSVRHVRICRIAPMSTFDGIVQEFPGIRIDYFCKAPERPPPLACFLSHVHSDHLQGLESLRAPFIYCSAATREILLRIEKYPHRMNFSKGILESRRLSYEHLHKLLRPIPLNTPTEIELTPRLSIRVTLFDANHCSGAVMFLIEGNGRAILYTGDIRAETWWVNSLVRHPILIPYTLGNKRLDTIYLDNTFARASHILNVFPSKAEGLSELLRKVALYPEDTTFYFRAWTFGYEEVWVALSAALNSKVHLDRYQLGLYKSLVSQGTDANEAPALCGYELGNRFVSGCLSENENTRIHSCEPGVQCSAIPSAKTVYLVPIVHRAKDGSKVPEIGIGGGAGDLYQIHDLELPDELALEQLDKLCLEQIHDPRSLSQTRKALFDAFRSKTKALSLDSYGMKDDHEISLDNLIRILSRGHSREMLWLDVAQHPSGQEQNDQAGDSLPKIIHFPYSRHSSYFELCELVAAFKPKDIVPCTVDPFIWNEDVSMQSLFGHLCSGENFTHDQHMRDMLANDQGLRSKKEARRDDTTTPQSSQITSSFPESIVESSIPSKRAAPHDQSQSLPRHNEISNTPLAPENAPALIQSSVETTSDIASSPKRPLIPTPTPETKIIKQNEIRQAWNLLNNARSEHPFYQLGSLPSSFDTEAEDELNDPTSDHAKANGSGVHDMQTESHHENGITQGSESPPRPSEMMDNMNNTNNIINTTNVNNTYLPHEEIDEPITESQNTHPFSIPSSAFDSQEQILDIHNDTTPPNNLPYPPEQEPNQITSNPDMLDDDDDDDQMNQSHTIRPSLNRSSSSRNRKAAYLAARADSFDAWASMSLVSAGNNHTEEEIEL